MTLHNGAAGRISSVRQRVIEVGVPRAVWRGARCTRRQEILCEKGLSMTTVAADVSNSAGHPSRVKPEMSTIGSPVDRAQRQCHCIAAHMRHVVVGDEQIHRCRE